MIHKPIVHINCRILLAFSICSTPIASETLDHSAKTSEAFLEFLLEFEDIDDETFELVVHHGIQDDEDKTIDSILKETQALQHSEVLDNEK